VAAYAIQFGQLGVRAHAGDPFGEFTLLLGWEQDVGAHPDHQRAIKLQALEAGRERSAILGEIEQV